MGDRYRRLICFAVFTSALFSGCSFLRLWKPERSAPDYSLLHGELMLRIENSGVRNPVILDALRAVPRHNFVPVALAEEAYGGHALPGERGAVVPAPLKVARTAEALALKKSDKVLEIGTGTGYQTAVTAHIVNHVFTISDHPELARSALSIFARLGYANISVRCGDPRAGWEENAPYDVIIVNTVMGRIPQALVNQLREGGRMFIPVINGEGEISCLKMTKSNGEISSEEIGDGLFPSDVPETGKIEGEQ